MSIIKCDTGEIIMMMRWVLSIFAVVFGLLTVKSGGFALFGGEAGKQFAGDYVPFVLWFNFLAGFLYIIAGVSVFRKKDWSIKLSIIIAVLTAVVFVAFGIAISTGVSFEMRTVGAMTFRTLFWVIVSILARKLFTKANLDTE